MVLNCHEENISFLPYSSHGFVPPQSSPGPQGFVKFPAESDPAERDLPTAAGGLGVWIGVHSCRETRRLRFVQNLNWVRCFCSTQSSPVSSAFICKAFTPNSPPIRFYTSSMGPAGQAS